MKIKKHPYCCDSKCLYVELLFVIVTGASLLFDHPVMARGDDGGRDVRTPPVTSSHGGDGHVPRENQTVEHEKDAGGAEGHAPDQKERDTVTLPPHVLEEFDITVQTAAGGRIEQTVRLPGEVVYNADRIANITPPVTGITQKINVSVGDRVNAGDVLAVLNSRELAVARSRFLAARARLDLARANLERDRRLFKQKVGTERAVQESRQVFEKAQIDLNEAETRLHALGQSDEQIERTGSLKHGKLNEYLLVTPLSGIVTQRHLTTGEVAGPARKSAPLVIADLSTVWVNLTVYQRDLVHVKAGQQVEIRFGHGILDTDGTIAFVSPALDESTRTAFARIVLDNPDGHWRPGLFVEGVVATGHYTAPVVVPRSAMIGLHGKQVVFVKTAKGFRPQHVRTGRRAEERVEVVEGLHPGERYAATSVLTLKAQLNRSALKHAGHAH